MPSTTAVMATAAMTTTPATGAAATASAGLSSAPSRKTESKAVSKKKKSSSLQQPKQASPSRGRTQTSDDPVGSTTGTQPLAPTTAKKLAATEATRVSSGKKHAPKQQTFKITREKERKEKLSKQAAADAATAHTSSDVDATATKVDSALEQDTVKSRNHKLFLAPSRQSQSPLNAAPSWGQAQRGPASAREAHTSSVADRLHEEILEYVEYTRSTVDAMTVHIEEMVANVRGCVLSLWPKSKIEPFGSYSTGIWLPSSDVDLVILGVVEIHDRMLTVKCLRQLAKALESQAWVESIVVLDTAKIPVLKLVTAESTVPIDITFESTATHSGLLARDLIKRYATEMPELYPLAVVFKQLLRERDLNDAYTGGLSSYSIVLMIIHFLLLSRYGERCFKAAAMFAAGMPLPRPADLLAEEARLRSAHRIAGNGARPSSDASSDDKTSAERASGAQPALSSSFACVVARAKSLKRPVSEAGRSASSSSDANGKPAQPFSYAAVAAGIVKLGASEPKPAPAPVSYAAAVTAPAPVSRPQGSQSSASLSKSNDSALDAISVTSSTADTEDSSSCSDSTTASAHEAEAEDDSSAARGDAAEEDRYISLGERTMTILEFYGIIFDYRKNGLSVRDGGYVYRLADHVGASGDLVKKLPALVIEDPIHPDRNVSASSFGFSRVVAVFEDAYYALKYFRPTRFTPSALSCLLSTSGHTPHQRQHSHSQSQAATATASSTSPSSSVWGVRKPFTQVVSAPPTISIRASS